MNAHLIKSLAGSIGALAILDGIYLTIRKPYHENLFYSIQQKPLHIRIFPAILVYAVLLFTIYFYAVRLAKSIDDAVMKGALNGFLMYVFYDLTNYATLTNYTVGMVIGDSLWGALLGGAAAAAGYYFS